MKLSPVVRLKKFEKSNYTCFFDTNRNHNTELFFDDKMTDQDEPPQQNPLVLLFNTERSFKSFEKNNKHLLYYVTNRFKNNFKECVVSVSKTITIKFDEYEDEMLLIGALNKNNHITYIHVSLDKKKELHNFDYCRVDLVID